jgi:shikimate kinase
MELSSLMTHPTVRAMSANFALIYASLFGFALLLTKKADMNGCANIGIEGVGWYFTWLGR